MKYITLFPAVWWLCPHCDNKILEIPEVVSVDSPDFKDPYELISQKVVDDDDDTDCMVQTKFPDSVICPHCFISYPALPDGVDPPEKEIE